jgi:hypothetical protein
MKKYFIRYKLETGLGTPEFYEAFDTIAERNRRIREIMASGWRELRFGIKN